MWEARAVQRYRRDMRRRGPWGGGWHAEPRPEWWPTEEPWPPIERARPWRGFGCLFGFLFVAGILGILALATRFVGDILDAPGLPGTLIRLAAFLVLIAIVAGLVRGGRAIRGTGFVLDDLVEQAARVEAGDYTARVDPVGPVPDPVRNLTRGFNTMAARLEADEAQRRSLLADVTHELRTPLAVVQGNVEAILDGVHPADEVHLGAILEETRVLGRLVDDLRTLALSEAGSLSLHREPTDLDVLSADVATSFAASAEIAGVAIDATVADDVPLLDVDPVRLREVLANLVGNALRHTPAGGRITIAGRRATPGDVAAATPPAVEIVVRDTGPGIDPDLLPHVFDRFARGPDSPGTGLGLSIARGLVELHGGTIVAASPPGGGTEIRITLPIDRA
jgi:two-component system, OmpR family, sensor histidine kinase BaeS